MNGCIKLTCTHKYELQCTTFCLPANNHLVENCSHTDSYNKKTITIEYTIWSNFFWITRVSALGFLFWLLFLHFVCQHYFACTQTLCTRQTARKLYALICLKCMYVTVRPTDSTEIDFFVNFSFCVQLLKCVDNLFVETGVKYFQLFLEDSINFRINNIKMGKLGTNGVSKWNSRNMLWFPRSGVKWCHSHMKICLSIGKNNNKCCEWFWNGVEKCVRKWNWPCLKIWC